MPIGPRQPSRELPVLDALEDRLPVTNLLSLTPAFLDSGLLSPGEGPAAAWAERGPDAGDLNPVFDDGSPLSPAGLAALAGVDRPSAAASSAPSLGDLAGDGAAASVPPAPAANVLGPPTSTGALPGSGALLAALAATLGRPTAAIGTEAAQAAHVPSPSGQGASLASAPRSAPAIGGGRPALRAAAMEPSSSPRSPTKTSGKGYTYYRDGSQTDVTTTSTPGLGLEGGGTDIDEFYQWMGSLANGGDFLVLGATKDDGYDSYIYDLNLNNSGPPYPGPPLNSVSTLAITSSDATMNSTSLQFVTNTINEAAAIFIMGGAQNNYVNLWQNTPIQTALDQAVARGVPIGGTSAGLAVLGQYVYSAENRSAVSSTVLANPYDSSITLDQGFLSVAAVQPPLQQVVPAQPALPYLENTLTDSHFYERDRMGRLVTFLARLVADPQWTPPSPGGPPTPLPGTKAIGIDESTALLIDPATGIGAVIGNTPTNHLYFLQTSGSEPSGQLNTQTGTLTLNAPLTWEGGVAVQGGTVANALLVHRATVGDTFSLQTWQTVSGGPEFQLSADYQLSAVSGTLTSTQAGGSIY
jgi:cyanophycinase-like exopeptidase